jgi:hypothetical protein
MANRLSMKVRLVVAALALALAAGGDFVNDLGTADPAQAQARGHATGGGD